MWEPTKKPQPSIRFRFLDDGQNSFLVRFDEWAFFHQSWLGQTDHHIPPTPDSPTSHVLIGISKGNMNATLATWISRVLMGTPNTLMHLVGPGCNALVESLTAALPPNSVATSLPLWNRPARAIILGPDLTPPLIRAALRHYAKTPVVLYGNTPLTDPELRQRLRASAAAFVFPAKTAVNLSQVAKLCMRDASGLPSTTCAPSDNVYRDNESMDYVLSEFEKAGRDSSMLSRAEVKDGFLTWCEKEGVLASFIPTSKSYLDRPLAAAVKALGGVVVNHKVTVADAPLKLGKRGDRVRMIKGIRRRRRHQPKKHHPFLGPCPELHGIELNPIFLSQDDNDSATDLE